MVNPFVPGQPEAAPSNAVGPRAPESADTDPVAEAQEQDDKWAKWWNKTVQQRGQLPQATSRPTASQLSPQPPRPDLSQDKNLPRLMKLTES